MSDTGGETQTVQTVPHTTEVVHAETAAAASPEHVEDSASDILASAMEALKASTQIAGARLNAIFNPETRKYEPRAEMIALHDIINANLSATVRLSRAQRMLDGLPED